MTLQCSCHLWNFTSIQGPKGAIGAVGAAGEDGSDGMKGMAGIDVRGKNIAWLYENVLQLFNCSM